MPAILEFPTLVRHAVEQFGTVFANAAERRHFAEYLTGLVVAEKKTVSGMNAEFAQTTDQSCLNRWITEVEWDAVQLNEQRLSWLQQDPQTRYAPSGVMPMDNTLVDHAGKLIEDMGYFWDHAEQRHKIAPDYLIACQLRVSVGQALCVGIPALSQARGLRGPAGATGGAARERSRRAGGRTTVGHLQESHGLVLRVGRLGGRAPDSRYLRL
jgi:hypothetical protein